MKLKKIASLALAGVMAVSMLAGCATKGEDNKNENTEVTTTAAVADYVNNLLTDAQKNIVKFQNDADLTAALKKVAGDSTKFTSEDIKTAYEKVSADYDSDLVTELAKALDVTDVGQAGFAVSKEGTQYDVQVYVVTGKLTEASAVQLVTHELFMTNLTSGNYPVTTGKYDCEYTGKVSAVKVTAPDTDKNSAWVVATVVAQTATEVTNV